jgi:hypothetical protein
MTWKNTLMRLRRRNSNDACSEFAMQVREDLELSTHHAAKEDPRSRVVIYDVDNQQGVAAAALIHLLDGQFCVIAYECYERDQTRWHRLASGPIVESLLEVPERPSARIAGPAGLLTLLQSQSSYRLDQEVPRSAERQLPYISSQLYLVAQEVSRVHLRGKIREVPSHGCVLAVWCESSAHLFTGRPHIRFLGSKGAVLTSLHPGDYLDRPESTMT